MNSLYRRAAAEALGSAVLVAAVVGSGIMGQKLAGGNVAIALLANTFATGAALVFLIITLGPVSGAHLNPAVTLAVAIRREHPDREVPAYIVAQVFGAVLGTVIAHIMFELPIVSVFAGERAGVAQSFANPAVTIARAFTDTFAGIRAVDVAPFICAQLFAVGIAVSLLPRLFPREETT